MSMLQWAEQECRLACKRENPDYNFDSNEFDYGCACYKSALKAYKALCEDEHSGMSWGFTKNILIRLMNGQPLSPITDEDFPPAREDADCEWLKERKLKSDIQCPRMSSLFRYEHLDGRVTYHDIDRAVHIDIEEPTNTYGAWEEFLDEMFPITMPYVPEKGKYEIYEQTFLVDEKNGDFDTRGIMYVKTPKGNIVHIGLYYATVNWKWTKISKEEYDYLLTQRKDPLYKKVASHLLWTLISNSANDDEIERREKLYKERSEEQQEKDMAGLEKLCRFFNDPEHWKYNTFDIAQALCKGDSKKYENIPALVKIADYLKYILTCL